MMTRTLVPLRVPPASLSYADQAGSPCCRNSVYTMRHDREPGGAPRSSGCTHSGIFMKLIVALLAFSGFALAQPVGVCSIFPSTNFWNVPVDTLGLHPNSLNIVNSIGAGAGLQLDNVLPINVAA